MVKISMPPCPLFAGLTAEETQEYLDRNGAVVIRKPAGAVLISPWERTGHIGVVLDGQLSERGARYDGESPHVLYSYAPGDIFGTDACFSDNGSYTEITADCDSRALLLSKSAVTIDDPVYGDRISRVLLRLVADRVIRQDMEICKLLERVI